MPGVHVVAAPIFVSGRLEATLALAAPAVRVGEGAEPRIARRLVAAAERISARLEGRS